MLSQTIALFRYQMLGILYPRMLGLYLVLILTAFALGGFFGELALINSQAVQVATIAEAVRYSLVLLVLLTVTIQIVEDFDTRQFERLLTMPMARWQYIAAEVLVIAGFCFLLLLPVYPLFFWMSDGALATYWVISLWLELVLIGLLALLAALSLEKTPVAVLFALAVYLLAKLSGFISLMVSESVRLSDGSTTSEFVQWVFSGILYMLPSHQSFADSDVFFQPDGLTGLILVQAGFTIVYGVLLVAVSLIDFYRKELAR